MSKHTAGVLSKSTIHDLLTEVFQKAIQNEKETYTPCFCEGKLAKGGEKKAERFAITNKESIATVMFDLFLYSPEYEHSVSMPVLVSQYST